jgi:hypothetical protein
MDRQWDEFYQPPVQQDEQFASQDPDIDGGNICGVAVYVEGQEVLKSVVWAGGIGMAARQWIAQTSWLEGK